MFCERDEDNEILYGKIYDLDSKIVAHHFCLVSYFLVSECLHSNQSINEM